MGGFFSDGADIWARPFSYRGVSFLLCYDDTAIGRKPFKDGHRRAQKEIVKLLAKWPYPVNRPDNTTLLDLQLWLDDNCESDYKILPMPSFRSDNYELGIRSIFFKDEADAMACKLRWL